MSLANFLTAHIDLAPAALNIVPFLVQEIFNPQVSEPFLAAYLFRCAETVHRRCNAMNYVSKPKEEATVCKRMMAKERLLRGGGGEAKTPSPPRRRGRALHASQAAAPTNSLAASVILPGASILLDTPTKCLLPASGNSVLRAVSLPPFLPS